MDTNILSVKRNWSKLVTYASLAWVWAEQIILTLQWDVFDALHTGIDMGVHILLNLLHISSPKLYKVVWAKAAKSIDISIDMIFHVLWKYGAHMIYHTATHSVSADKTIHFGQRMIDIAHHSHCKPELFSSAIMGCLIAEQVIKSAMSK